MIFELFIATCAGFVWLHFVETGQEGFWRQIAYNAMLTASISTILFNANPLMRFDGYYILADFLEVPNLAQRSNNMLKHLIQKYIYRLENLTPPSTVTSEQAILIIYGIAALAYRIFLFISITLYVMGQLYGIGFALAIWTASVWFILPVGNFIKWLASGPKLAEHRMRHVLVSLLMIAVGVAMIGVVPFPDHRRAVGVVESTERTVVYFGAPGFIDEVPEYVRPGAQVRAGDVLARLRNEDLEQERAIREVQVEDLELQERLAQRERRPIAAQLARQQIGVLREQLAEIDELMGKLTVRAPHDGVIAGSDPQTMQGVYVEIGQPLCEVVDPNRIRIEGTLSQRDGWIYPYQDKPEEISLEIRRRSRVAEALPSRVTRVLLPNPQLPHASLGYAGGGQIATEQGDESGRQATSFLPRVWAEPVLKEGQDPLVFVDERVSMRFRLPSKPLAVQWWDRLSKLMQGRVNM